MKTLNFTHRALIYILLVSFSCILTGPEAHARVKNQVAISYASEIRWPFGLTSKKAAGQKVTNCPAQGKFSFRNSRNHHRSCYKFK